MNPCYPWLHRGGGFIGGVNLGMFALYPHDGSTNTSGSFRGIY